MRKVVAIAALGLLTLSLPALATVPANDLNDSTPSGPGPANRVECPGTVVWDNGMFDEFTPPVGCSSAYSTGCFINAIDDGGFGADWRQGAVEFIGVPGDPITNLKFWIRYNQQGYDYHLANNGLHGFCVRFYDDPSQGGICPDGNIPDALGSPVYDQYIDASHFVEEEIFTGVVRNFNACVTLPVPFYAAADHFYWVNVSADFDFTSYGGGVTQFFHRMAPPGSAILCEGVVNYNSVAGDHQNWIPVWAGLNIPCWQGWDPSMKIYTNPVAEPTGACCIGADCTITTEAGCSGTWMGQDVPCDPNPCATPTKQSTWGGIKAGYR